MASTFQCGYCQCFAFKICNKVFIVLIIVGFFAEHHTKFLSVEFSVAGLDRAKFGIDDFKVFFGYCCHSDIDFTENCILTNSNL